MTPGMEALAEIARAERARVLTTPCPEHRQPEPANLNGRPLDSYYGPAPTFVIRQLVRELAGHRTETIPSRTRTRVQQAVARGRGVERIAADLDIDLDTVLTVVADMDRAAS